MIRYLSYLLLVGAAMVTAGGIWVVQNTNEFRTEQSASLSREISAATTTRVEIGSTTIQAELVRTPDKRRQGLSGRTSLAPKHGMLFIFDEPQDLSFWMKDMYFPIDMIWIGADKTVVGITDNVRPTSYPKTFGPPEPAQYVLEVNAGAARQWGIETGNEVRW